MNIPAIQGMFVSLDGSVLFKMDIDEGFVPTHLNGLLVLA